MISQIDLSKALKCYAGYHFSAQGASHSNGGRLQSTSNEKPATGTSGAHRMLASKAREQGASQEAPRQATQEASTEASQEAPQEVSQEVSWEARNH